VNCEQILPYVPGFVGGELRPQTVRIVGDHLTDCASCSKEVAVQRRVVASLATLAEREVEAPAFLADVILEGVHGRSFRRVLPVLPLPVADVARVITDNREAIAQAAGTALVAAGAAYALWRALRASRGVRPATS